MNELLKNCLSQTSLLPRSQVIEKAVLPAARILKDPGEGRLGGSRLGGVPDVPAQFQWPQHHGSPLPFLAQINFAELPPGIPWGSVPAEGLALFFYDTDNQPSGLDPADRGSAQVILVRDAWSLVPAPVPAALRQKQAVRPAFPLCFTVEPSLPAEGTILQEAMGLATGELEDYADLWDMLHEQLLPDQPRHQALGHSHDLLGEMQWEAQLVTHGLYCGDASGYNDPRAAALEEGARDWRLLLQLDSDSGLGWEWGDAGLLFFWIREADLQLGRLDQAWAILQD